MITTKFIRRFKKRVFKYEAVLGVFWMITLAAIVGFWVGKEITEQDSLREISGIVLGIIFGAILSWDMVDSLIGEAIETKVKEELRAANEGYSVNSPSLEVTEQQELEYLTIVPQSHRNGGDIYSLPTQTDDLENYKQDFISREAAVRGLDVLTQEAIIQGLDIQHSSLDDSQRHHAPLKLMALSSAMKALRIDKKQLTFDDKEYLKDNEESGILRADIYVYLKAWLMKTIKFGRPMRADRIRQRHPDASAYIRALEYIKQNSIHSKGVNKDIRKFIDDDLYVNRAIEILDYYISVLIEQLRNIEERKMS